MNNRQVIPFSSDFFYRLSLGFLPPSLAAPSGVYLPLHSCHLVFYSHYICQNSSYITTLVTPFHWLSTSSRVKTEVFFLGLNSTWSGSLFALWPHRLLILPWFIWLQPHWPPGCSENKPDTFPLGLCTSCSSIWNFLPPGNCMVCSYLRSLLKSPFIEVFLWPPYSTTLTPNTETPYSAVNALFFSRYSSSFTCCLPILTSVISISAWILFLI